MTSFSPDIRLSNMPLSVKLLFTAVLFSLGTGYLFALGNIALKVGFTPEEAALKYYGNETSRAALEEMTDTEVSADEAGVSEAEEFSFDDLEEQEAESEPLVPVPTFEALVTEGHFHLFGYVSIFFICGLIIIFAAIPRWLKGTLVLAPFIASVLDIWSMLLTRFVGPGFAWLLVISGTIMALSFLLVFVISIYQLWFQKSEAR
ncbi:MAG: hypothetical protein O3C45_08285 [Bacteroidetes bacterium]|nr:hypothetical protein [Bacteroidota bacterium]MDA0875043.1 hypothetical protein [Bacteroidota bacterium]